MDCKDNDLWWAGGQFDGDGCISTRQNVQLFVRCGKAEKGLASLQKLQTMFGGRIYAYKPKPNPTHQRMYDWQVTGVAAKHLCARLAPYCFAKQPQLQLAAQWPVVGIGKRNTPDAVVAKQTRIEMASLLKQMKRIPHVTVDRQATDAYWAGFFDAEGCVHVKKLSLGVSIGQKYDALLNEMGRVFQGKVCHSCGSYNLCLYGDKARTFIDAIKPYSVEKLSQLKLVENMFTDPETSSKINKLKGRRPL